MTFAEFQTFREATLRERPDVLDCAATNLYRALARLVPPPTPAPTLTVHRCHLASHWCERFGFPTHVAGSALVSCGVRDSLTRIFACLARENATLWLPEDNYPVYGELARAARLAPREFSTLPEPTWPHSTPADGAEFLLVTNPLKPLGRGLSESEVVALEAWLAASSRRRLLLDAVYTFSTRFDAATLRLLAGGQTILLHSLTKGWLHPRLFGIALVPPVDADRFVAAFRAEAPPQSHLARARECLCIQTETPCAVAKALEHSMHAIRAAIAARAPLVRLPLTGAPTSATYFLPIEADCRALLRDHAILALPATVFGSPRMDIAILSSLAFCP